MAPVKMRAWFRRLHLFLGFAIVFPALVIAATGIALGMYDQLRYSRPPYRLAAPVSVILPPGELYQALVQQLAGAELTTLYPARSPGHAASARLGDDRLAFLNPQTGHVIALEKSSDWKTFLIRLHRGKLWGFWGQVAVNTVGVGLLGLWISGVVQQTNRSKARTGKLARRTHLRFGLPAGALLAWIALTGAANNFRGPLTEWLDPVPKPASEPVVNPPAVKAAIEAGLASYRRAPVESIHFSSAPGTPLQLYFRDSSRVYVDAITARPLKISAWSSHWSRSLHALHTGLFLGDFHVAWTILGGTLLLVLAGTGAWLGIGPRVRAARRYP